MCHCRVSSVFFRGSAASRLRGSKVVSKARGRIPAGIHPPRAPSDVGVPGVFVLGRGRGDCWRSPRPLWRRRFVPPSAIRTAPVPSRALLRAATVRERFPPRKRDAARGGTESASLGGERIRAPLFFSSGYLKPCNPGTFVPGSLSPLVPASLFVGILAIPLPCIPPGVARTPAFMRGAEFRPARRRNKKPGPIQLHAELEPGPYRGRLSVSLRGYVASCLRGCKVQLRPLFSGLAALFGSGLYGKA